MASSIQGVVEGSFSPLGKDAEVSLQLVSTSGDKTVLGSAKFTISGDELTRRNLSLLPPQISQAEFNAKQSAIAPYSGKDNAFTLTVTPDDLDGIYYDGEYMTMQLYAERDCYFKISHLDVNGVIQVIYPVSSQENNFIRAGETRRIPDTARFRLGSPFGEEYILVAGYSKPFSIKNEGEERLSASAISRGLYREDAQPFATAKFAYTILPKDSGQ